MNETIKPLRFDVTGRYARAYDMRGKMLGQVMSVGDQGEHAVLNSEEPLDVDLTREDMIIEATRARVKLARMVAKDVTLLRRRQVVEPVYGVNYDGEVGVTSREPVSDKVIRWHEDTPYLLFPEGDPIYMEMPAQADDAWEHPVYGPGVLTGVAIQWTDGKAQCIGYWRPVMGHISLAPLIEKGRYEVMEI